MRARIAAWAPTRAASAFVGVATLAGALLGPVGTAQAVDAGLAGRWDLDAATPAGGSAWQVADSSGNGLNATGTMQPTIVAGKWGNAVRFGPGRRLSAPGNAPGLKTASGTLSLWFQAAANPDEARYLAGKGAPDSCENASYALFTGYSAPGTTNLGLQGYTYDGSDTTYSGLAPGNPWDAAWHAVALVFDGGFARMYYDGQALGSRGVYPFTSPGGPTLSPKYDDLPFAIGDNPSSACGDRSFGGSIDEVRYYSRALSAEEIGRLQNAASATPPDADLPPAVQSQPQPGPQPQPTPPAPTPLPALAATTVLSWKLYGSGRTVLTSLVLEGVKDGDVVKVDCKGSGCKKSTKRTVTLKKVKKGRYRLAAAVKDLSLGPKATLTITIARAGFASRVISYETVRRKDPVRTSRCQTPGAKTTYVC